MIERDQSNSKIKNNSLNINRVNKEECYLNFNNAVIDFNWCQRIISTFTIQSLAMMPLTLPPSSLFLVGLNSTHKAPADDYKAGL